MDRDPTRRDVVRRYFRRGRLTFAHAAVGLGGTRAGTLLWVPVGTEFAGPHHADGSRMREPTPGQLAAAQWRRGRWTGNDVLMLVRPGRAHSVWWFFTDGVFTGWYVNLEAPARWWAHGPDVGMDTVDHALDLTVAPDRTWRWKDETEYRAATRAGTWSRGEALAIRAEGRRVADEVGAARFPFDGTWCAGRPEVAGRPPELGPAPRWLPGVRTPGRAA